MEVTPGTSGHDVLTQPRNYYSNDTIQQYNQTTNNYTNIDKRTVNVYDSKTTNYNSTVYAYDAGDTC